MKIEDIHKHLGKRVVLNIPATAVFEARDLLVHEGRAYTIPPINADITLFGGLDLDGNVTVLDYFSNTYTIHHKYIDIPPSKYILDVCVNTRTTRFSYKPLVIRVRATGVVIGTYYNEEQANKVLAILNSPT